MTDYNISNISEDKLPEPIGPEVARIADTYLTSMCSTVETAKKLNLEVRQIDAVVNSKHVKSYINNILRESGHRHMIKIVKSLEKVIDLKLEEMEEAEIGSNKDIADLLSLAHKMQVDIANLIQRDQKNNGPFTQNNTQINHYGEGNYGKLMEMLVKDV